MSAESYYKMLPGPGWEDPGAHIPTEGAAGTALDQYRVVEVASTALPESGVAFMDVSAINALAKLGEGGLASFVELEAAETALQAMLLHERVHVICPAPKIVHVDNGAKLGVYARAGLARTSYSYELQAIAGGNDWLIAPECVLASNGKGGPSTVKGSVLTGQDVASIGPDGYWADYIADAVNVAIRSHSVAGYLADPRMQSFRHDRGFTKALYQRIRYAWGKTVSAVPPVEVYFETPPLVAIVLDRLGTRSRAHLAAVISELRSELVDTREELRELDRYGTSSRKQREIDARVKHINLSFDAIVPESRLTDAERRRRLLLRIYKPVRAVFNFAAAFASNGGASIKDVEEFARASNDVLHDETLIERTITAKTFAGLFDTGPVQDLVRQHLTNEEIYALEGLRGR